MVKKAKLDILEIAVDDEDGAALPPAADIPGPEAAGEAGAAAPGADNPAPGKGRRAFLWTLGAGLVLLAAAAGWWALAHPRSDAGPPAPEPMHVQRAAAPLTAAESVVLLEGLIVDQADEKGGLRILFCDVALELASPEMARTVGQRAEVRESVYGFLQREAALGGLTAPGRERLKQGIAEGLNRIVGENCVENVYFMRYELQ